MKIDFKVIGERIRSIRIGKCLSQEQIAELSNLSTGYISNIETAKKKLSLQALLKITIALDVPLDEILVGNQTIKTTDYRNEISALFDGCSQYERKLIIDAARNEKQSLLNCRYLIANNIIDEYEKKQI